MKREERGERSVNKSLRVTVSFEFSGINDANSDAANEILESLHEDLEVVRRMQEADAVWIDDAVIVSGGREVAA